MIEFSTQRWERWNSGKKRRFGVKWIWRKYLGKCIEIALIEMGGKKWFEASDEYIGTNYMMFSSFLLMMNFLEVSFPQLLDM